MSTPALYAERVVNTSGDCPMCGGLWMDHAHLGGASIRCPDGTTVDVLPASAVQVWSPNTRGLAARERTVDLAFGIVCVAIGAASITVGLTRWHANVPLASYGVGLIACGALLIRSGLRP